MKKIILAAVVLLSSFRLLAADPGVDEKVLDAFSKTFRNAENVTWSSYDYTYEVRFEQNKITARVTYDRQGNILRTIRYYHEDMLPVMLLEKIKTRFADKSVFGVVEESSEEGTFYHVTLEDQQNWLEVKADSYGSLVVEKKFRKANP